MSDFYKPNRKQNLYQPNSDKPYKISRSKIDLFLECPRCFYLDRRKGIGRPPGFPFNLNSAVDELLKKEFDVHRAGQKPHPMMEQYGVDAVPFEHEKMDEWRENFKGVQFHHKQTKFIVTGAVDDIWINPQGELIVVDYKATSKAGDITLNAMWQVGYKRQVEVYQWLLRQNGFNVSDTTYFVYCNGLRDKEAFDKKLEFDVYLLPYTGDTSWIEKTLIDMEECLSQEKIVPAAKDCDYCRYREAVSVAEQSENQLNLFDN